MSTMNYTLANRYGTKEWMLHERLQLDTQARIVVDLITKWGMVAAVPEGEDSSGRQMVRLMTPEELVDRAIQTTDLLLTALKKDGHLLMLPELPVEPPQED